MTNTHYILIESLENTYHAGGVVMLPILLAGVVGFYYLFSSWFRIGSDFFRTGTGQDDFDEQQLFG